MPFIAEVNGVYKLSKSWCCQSFPYHTSYLFIISVKENIENLQLQMQMIVLEVVSARGLRQLNLQSVYAGVCT